MPSPTTQLLPALKPAELESLRTSIQRDGVKIPVIVRSGGEIVDGHHRRMVAAELGVPCPEIQVDLDDETANRLRLTLNLNRRHLADWERLEILAELGRPLVEQAKAEAKREQGARTDLTSRKGVPRSVRQARDRAAERLAAEIERTGAHVATVSGKTLEKALAFAALPPERKAAVASGESTVTAEIRAHRKQEKQVAAAGKTGPDIRDVHTMAASGFPVIVIDPPWRYDNVATRGAAEDHYPTMSLEELAELPLPAADNAHLYLWVTNSFLRQGFDLMDAWGFTYKTTLTWVKPQIGMGNWFRNSTEHVLFGVKGKLPTLRNNCPTWFQADRTKHSAKPECFYDLVESCSPGPYMEMFARRRRFGWQTHGNES